MAEIKKIIKKNVFFSLYILVCIASIIVFVITLARYQLKDHNKVDKRLNRIRYSSQIIQAKRGSIISSDNHKLAFDIDMHKIVLDPMNIRKTKKYDKSTIIEKIASVISTYTKLEKNDLIVKIVNAIDQNNRNLDLKYKVSLEDKEKILTEIREISNDKIVFFDKDRERYFNSYDVFKNLIGFFTTKTSENDLKKTIDIKSASYGLEKRYDKYLSGENGIKRSFVPASDKKTVVASTVPYKTDEKILKQPKDGNDLHITIDTVMQFSLNEELKNIYKKFSPVSVMGIIMESNTGKIIALDSYPKSKNNGNIKNLNISDVFEPGSIFKPITTAIALNEKVINKNTIINSNGYIAVKDRVFHDHDNSTVGDLTLKDVIAKSGNVAMVKIASLIDTKTFYNYLKRFGLGEKTGIDTDYELKRNLFKQKDLTEVKKATVSFGQGIDMTQLQILNILNATINGGKVLKPYIVDYITDENNQIVFKNEPTVIDTPISKKTSDDIRKLLVSVVEEGTGKSSKISGYNIGGKTGTAQKSGKGGYIKGKYFSSFFAFLPADKPKYSMIITVNEPSNTKKGTYYASVVAVPSVRIIAEKLINYKTIIPDYEKEVKLEDQKIIRKQNRSQNTLEISEKLKQGIMPNFIGLSLKELILLDGFSKYNINYTGSGNVFMQNIKEDTKINENTMIILKLR